MGDKVGPLRACNLNQLAGDAGPCQRRPQQVSVLINSIGLNRGPNEVLHKLSTQVLNENLHNNKERVRDWLVSFYSALFTVS